MGEQDASGTLRLLSFMLQSGETGVPGANATPYSRASVTKHIHDFNQLSVEVRDHLRGLHELLRQLDSKLLRKIPLNDSAAADFGREVASMIVTLGFLNSSLILRAFSGDRIPNRPEPWRLLDALEATKLPPRRPRAKIAEHRLRNLLTKLNRCISLLDEDSLMSVPVDPNDVPEFLAYSTTIQSNLAWYLDVEWFPRMSSFDGPMGE